MFEISWLFWRNKKTSQRKSVEKLFCSNLFYVQKYEFFIWRWYAQISCYFHQWNSNHLAAVTPTRLLSSYINKSYWVFTDWVIDQIFIDLDSSLNFIIKQCSVSTGPPRRAASVFDNHWEKDNESRKYFKLLLEQFRLLECYFDELKYFCGRVKYKKNIWKNLGQRGILFLSLRQNLFFLISNRLVLASWAHDCFHPTVTAYIKHLIF